MKKLLTTYLSAKGFTLIELLVVIGILGILSSALVATIDPFEQLKKANDANTKNVAVEFLNGNIRYYTTHATFPWDTAINGGAACNGAADPDGTKTLVDAPLSTCVTALITEKELKTGFDTATNIIKEIYAKGSIANKTLMVCFKPQSASQQKSAETKYCNGAGLAGPCNPVCKSTAGGTADCYWCTE